jgi:type VI secretion system protein ImpA
MPTAPFDTDELLDPISADQPAGSDLRWTAEWDRIKEARRSDDPLDSGKWAKKERKAADWRLARELAVSMLRDRSKDLQLALWLTEADIKLRGFVGLRDGLRVTRELMLRYWDKGLYPVMEDGPEDRAGPFEWLSNKLVDAIAAIPITVRSDGGIDYSFVDQQDALRVGSEANCKDPYGEVDTQKKKAYDQALAEGHVSLEMFDSAVKETRRADYEELHSVFLETHDEFKALERVIDEKFGEAAPSLADCRAALSEMKKAISEILEKKRWAEPQAVDLGAGANSAGQSGAGGGAMVLRFPLSLSGLQDAPSAAGSSWQEAEQMIRSGQLERGLSEMTRLAAAETNGRRRFQRKLLLAGVCLSSQRERLARLLLEELAEQIDKFQLEQWESSELIASVWIELYRLYKRAGGSSDVERADKLYERLSRLDPWQALGCTEG